ncbi:ORF-38 [Teiidae poxvirus 1]|nr:ORF-38 [Teiidae poxvirus 1]
MAFPCNQFKNQEPGDRETIMKTLKKYNVSFDVSEKILVNTIYAHPLWKWLQTRTTLGVPIGPIKWNFCKFLISPKGYVVKRFDPEANPLSLQVDIDNILSDDETTQNKWVVSDARCMF